MWSTVTEKQYKLLPLSFKDREAFNNKKREIVWFFTKGGVPPPPPKFGPISRFFLGKNGKSPCLVKKQTISRFFLKASLTWVVFGPAQNY
jgi:hypothetical protein